jgi:Mg/Co/Ni transporter MgtE
LRKIDYHSGEKHPGEIMTTEVIEVEKKTTKGEVTEILRRVEIIEIRGKDHHIGVMEMG